MSSNNSKNSLTRISPNRVSPLPPTANISTSIFFPTVLEEESDAFSQTSSGNDDEHDVLVGTFETDVEQWNPVDTELPAAQEQCFSPSIGRISKPRRRLPMIATNANNSKDTGNDVQENGSCSFDSGISRLLSSVDRAVNSVTNKTTRKPDEYYRCQETDDKKFKTYAHKVLSLKQKLTQSEVSSPSSMQTDPVLLRETFDNESPTGSKESLNWRRSNSLKGNSFTFQVARSPTAKCKIRPGIGNERRFSDQGPNITSEFAHSEIPRNVIDSNRACSNCTSSVRNDSLQSNLESSSNSYCKTRCSSNTTPNIAQDNFMSGNENNNVEIKFTAFEENSSPRTTTCFCSPSVSPPVIYSSPVLPSSPGPMRIGRRMLPEPPRQSKINHLRHIEINDIEKHRKNDAINGKRQASPTAESEAAIPDATYYQQKNSCNPTTAALTTIQPVKSSSSRPTIAHHFFSNIIVSSREALDRTMNEEPKKSPISSNITPSAVPHVTAWTSDSSRDSLDSGFISTGHSRSTTCDSTSSNTSGGSGIGLAKIATPGNEYLRNPSSPMSNGASTHQISNESSPPPTRKYRLRRSYGAPLPGLSYETFDFPNDDCDRMCSLSEDAVSSYGDYNNCTANSSTHGSITSKSDCGASKSNLTVYNRVQSLPSQDTPEKTDIGCTLFSHQQSLPLTSYLSRSSEIVHSHQNGNKSSKQSDMLPVLRGSLLGARVHFDADCVYSSDHSEPHNTDNSKDIENNHSTHGADVRCDLPRSDLLCSTNHDQGYHYRSSLYNENYHKSPSTKTERNLSLGSFKCDDTEFSKFTSYDNSDQNRKHDLYALDQMDTKNLHYCQRLDEHDYKNLPHEKDFDNTAELRRKINSIDYSLHDTRLEQHKKSNFLQGSNYFSGTDNHKQQNFQHQFISSNTQKISETDDIDEEKNSRTRSTKENICDTLVIPSNLFRKEHNIVDGGSISKTKDVQNLMKSSDEDIQSVLLHKMQVTTAYSCKSSSNRGRSPEKYEAFSNKEINDDFLTTYQRRHQMFFLPKYEPDR